MKRSSELVKRRFRPQHASCLARQSRETSRVSFSGILKFHRDYLYLFRKLGTNASDSQVQWVRDRQGSADGGARSTENNCALRSVCRNALSPSTEDVRGLEQQFCTGDELVNRLPRKWRKGM
eukprot:6173658-Pleurochrysis_carterae.AAC.1